MNNHYYILSVSKNHAKIFEVSADNILPREIPGMPSSLADAWKGMERDQAMVTSHSSGGGNSMYHGQGGAKDVVEEEEDMYMHELAKSVHKILHESHLPVVFAGVSEEYGMFKKFDDSGYLVEEYVQGSPDHVTMEELKAKADPIVEAHVKKSNERYLEEYGNLQGTGRTSTDKQQISVRADEGKVELLLVSDESFDANKAIADHVKAHKGRVAVIANDKMPESAEVAAILRY